MFRLSQPNSTIVSRHNSFLQQNKKLRISKNRRRKLSSSSKALNFHKKKTDHSPNIFVFRISLKFVVLEVGVDQLGIPPVYEKLKIFTMIHNLLFGRKCTRDRSRLPIPNFLCMKMKMKI